MSYVHAKSGPYRKPLAEMFAGLDVHQQRVLIDQLALLPQHIRSLAAEGLIAEEVIREVRWGDQLVAIGPRAPVGN